MRLAIVSDTHLPRGARRLPDACVAHLHAADLILHAGDVITPEVLAMIAAIGPPVRAVHGNVDVVALRERLPERDVVVAGDARIGMVHDAGQATGRLARLRGWFPDCDAVVFGHSHIPLHAAHDGFQIFNPGSPTDRRRQPRHTMGLAEVHGRDVTFTIVGVDPGGPG